MAATRNAAKVKFDTQFSWFNLFQSISHTFPLFSAFCFRVSSSFSISLYDPLTNFLSWFGLPEWNCFGCRFGAAVCQQSATEARQAPSSFDERMCLFNHPQQGILQPADFLATQRN